MAIRNELTARMLSKVRTSEQVLTVCCGNGEIWEEANALGNAKDMLTSQR